MNARQGSFNGSPQSVGEAAREFDRDRRRAQVTSQSIRRRVVDHWQAEEMIDRQFDVTFRAIDDGKRGLADVVD